jgi:flagellar hook assembly protein FlgD
VDVQKSDEGDWGNRVSSLTVTHKDYVGKQLRYQEHGDIGVDSGQAGIFCESSYRNDDVAETIKNGNGIRIDSIEDGDKWYEKMCRFTLSGEGFGAYESGVVTSSGFGDGSYPLAVARDEDKNIVSMVITYIGEEDEEDEDDGGDCCGVCGGELESDGECIYCCDEK